MKTLITRLVREEHAQDLVEYGIALAVVGAGAGVAAVSLAVNMNALWSTCQSVIDAAVATAL